MRAASCRRSRPGSSPSSPTAWSTTCSIDGRYSAISSPDPPNSAGKSFSLWGYRALDHSIGACQLSQRTPGIACQARPVVKRERAATQAGIACDRIVLVDPAQDRVLQLGVDKLLRRADELLAAHTLA